MADTTLDKDINAQIEELRSQIGDLSAQLSGRIEAASQGANEMLSSAKAKASHVSDQARTEGRNLVRAAKENPAATSSIFVGGVLLGLFAGFLIGRLSE
ncbi:hypothetical protein GR212_25225 [Rhizobium lusitanum]|uniref:DUF883 family protein n=1 Tax=Rhizobium lusitanum TaxID=293958 RepID=A0A6L9UE18_9HYPH|nr:hypothetical protein [Rhizobium lusitanum]NEI72868.1 hypothetical protein [Rhizobium lusitanum]